MYLFTEVEDLDELMVVEDEEEEPVVTAKKRKLEDIDTPSAKKLKMSDGATNDIVDDDLIVL